METIQKIKKDGSFLECIEKYFPPNIIISMNHGTFVKCIDLEKELCAMVSHLGLVVQINMGSRLHINVYEK